MCECRLTVITQERTPRSVSRNVVRMQFIGLLFECGVTVIEWLQAHALFLLEQRYPVSADTQNLDLGSEKLWRSYLKTEKSNEPIRGKQRLATAAHLCKMRSERTHILRFSVAEGMNRNNLFCSVLCRKEVLGSAKEQHHSSNPRSGEGFWSRLVGAKTLVALFQTNICDSGHRIIGSATKMSHFYDC